MPSNTEQWRRDIEVLVSLEKYLQELSNREDLMYQTAMPSQSYEYTKWVIRLEDAASTVARFRATLENRICAAVAERLDESPLPPDKWVEQPDGSFLPSPICPKQ